MDRTTILERVTSVCATPAFGFRQAVSPFDFDVQPSGFIDAVFRVEVASQAVVGGLSYAEERTDRVTIWVARKQGASPLLAYTQLVTDVTSLYSAVIHDGATGGGDFAVLDGTEMDVTHRDGQEFAVGRMALPINYEVTV